MRFWIAQRLLWLAAVLIGDVFGCIPGDRLEITYEVRYAES